MIAAFVFAGFATPAKAQTVEELQAMIAQLMATIQAMQGGTATASSCTTFGLPGIMGVQQAVNQLGYAPALVADGKMGPNTRAGVMWAQNKLGVSADGAWGPMTNNAYMAWLSTCSTGTTTPTPSNPGSLNGGAGSVDQYDLDSTYSNEEVGEGTSDVEVYGLEIEASDESDLMVTAVTIDLGDNTDSNTHVFADGSDKFDDYASELSIWFNGDKVAEIDADEFEDDNGYRRTITLDSGVIIEAGDTETLVVAVSGANTIDSDDFDQAWTIAIDSVRFMDGQGVVITEDPLQGDETFTFETFASSANTKLSIEKGSDDINDSRVIKVEDNDSVDDVEILSFFVEIEGSSDVMVDDIVVEFTVDGTATDLNDIASKVTLWMDGDEIASENATTDETVTFDNLDLDLKAGDDYEFIVAVDILEYDAAGTYDLGDTISATVGETERNLWDAEDEEGDDLVAGDRDGVESSEAHSLSLAGVELRDVNDSVNTLANSDAAGSISWEFTLEAEDEAIEFDIDDNSDVTSAGSDVKFTLTGTDITIGTTTIVLVSGDATVDGEGWDIAAGDDATFILETTFTTVDANDNGTYRVRLDSVEGVKVDEISGGLLLAFEA